MRSADAATRLNLLQLAIWTALAVAVVPGRAHFLYDEAYFYHQAIQVARHAAFPVYGPPISGTMPVAFTPGGTAYLLLGVPFVFGSDPGLGAAWLIVLSSLAVWCLDRAFKAYGLDPVSRVFTAAVLTWSTWHVRLVDRIWNNHVEWPLALFLLAIAVRLATRPSARPRLLMALFGVTAAVLAQAHLQGTLAVAACGALVAIGNPEYRRPRPWLPAVIAAGLLYLPYAAFELTHDAQNTAWLRGAGALAHVRADAIVRGALAPVSMQSLFPFALIAPDPLHAVLDGNSVVHWIQLAVSLASLVAAACFFLRASLLRPFVLICWLLVPLYFLANGREYHDHYLYSLAPFFVMPLGLALGRLFHGSRAWAVAAVCFLALWVGVHTAHWVPEYLAGLHRPTLASQMQRAEAAARRPQALRVSAGDPDVFIVWALAKDRFGRTLLFSVAGRAHPCLLDIGPRRTDVQVPPVGWDSYFRCPEDRR